MSGQTWGQKIKCLIIQDGGNIYEGLVPTVILSPIEGGNRSGVIK